MRTFSRILEFISEVIDTIANPKAAWLYDVVPDSVDSPEPAARKKRSKKRRA